MPATPRPVPAEASSSASGDGPLRTPRRRSASALRIDEELRDAAIDVLRDAGPDAIGLAAVAARAGYTYGATYARYESQGDLLADLWQTRLEAAFSTLAVAVARLREDPADRTARGVAFGPPSAPRLVAIDLVIASARIGDLGDVVPGAVRRIVTETGLIDDPAGIGLLALALGAAVYAPADGPLEPVGTRFLDRTVGVVDRVPTGPPPEPDPAGEIRFDTGDALRDRLLRSAVAVVARSGAHGISLRRIARASGYGPTIVYSRYEKLGDLLVDLVVTGSRATQSPETLRRTYSTADGLAASLAGWALPEVAVRRRLALEIHLAAVHDPALMAGGVATDRETHRDAAPLVAPDATDDALRRQQLARDASFGAALLADLGLTSGMDWRPFTRIVIPDG